jgi:hypothetical protein
MPRHICIVVNKLDSNAPRHVPLAGPAHCCKYETECAYDFVPLDFGIAGNMLDSGIARNPLDFEEIPKH